MDLRCFPQFSFFSPLGRLLNFFDFGVIILGAAGLEVVLRWLASQPRASKVGQALAVVVLGITAVELVAYGRKVNPEFPPREDRFSFPRTPIIRRLGPELAAGHNGPGRLIPIRRTVVEADSPPILSANESMLFGFESAAGWDSTLPSRAETLWRIVSGEPVDAVLGASHRRAYWASFDVAGTRLDILPRAGVTTIVTAPEVADEPRWEERRLASTLDLQPVYAGIDGRIYRIAGADGGPIVVPRPVVVNDSRGALDWILNPHVDSTVRRCSKPTMCPCSGAITVPLAAQDPRGSSVRTPIRRISTSASRATHGWSSRITGIPVGPRNSTDNPRLSSAPTTHFKPCP